MFATRSPPITRGAAAVVAVAQRKGHRDMSGINPVQGGPHPSPTAAAKPAGDNEATETTPDADDVKGPRLGSLVDVRA
jgi:hypothetical protein